MRILGHRVPDLVVWYVPLVGVAAWVAYHRAPRPERRARFVLAAWVVLAGLVVAITLSPSLRGSVSGAFEGSPSCTLTPDWGVRGLLARDQRVLNVVAFVPLGVLVALARGRRTRRGLAGASLALPLLVEAGQWALPGLVRRCDATDVLANWLGFGLGLGLGAVVVAVAARRGAPPGGAAPPGPEGPALRDGRPGGAR